MTNSLLDILIVTGFLGLLFEYKKIKNNVLYLLLILAIFYYSISLSNIWELDLFNLGTWKIIFLCLVFISFLIVFELIKEKTFDIYCLSILVFIGSIILIVCDNFITLYLGLELQTFSIFILIAKNRISIRSSEAGLKYFILGALSSGFYLLGLILLFLFGFSLNIKDLVLLSSEIVVIISLSLITLSFCFKLSLFPLHFWIPDIYEGSSWDVIALVSTVPKISMICVLSQFLINSNLLLSFSLVSIGIGTLGALNQSKLKRLLAYSGISHMGFIILGYSILTSEGYVISNIYLLLYTLTMLSVFILVINSNFNSQYIIELGGLKFINKTLAITLVFLILSIAGIPPLSGFISKWFLLWTSIEFKYNTSALIIILFSAIGAGYYLRIVKIIYFQKKSSYFLWKDILEIKETNTEMTILFLGLFLFITLFLIFNFSSLINIINCSIYNFF
uniref:NADH:ubiquinone reductase (H(+)-translocating) n=1 Tax=Tiaropsis multicirrata TaxID=662020 RepID=A0A0S2IB45_9CNID|nr:NADH dehydrogenase subunit 2 [Tiaropsis multicirrata]